MYRYDNINGVGPVSGFQVSDLVTLLLRAAGSFSAISGLKWMVGIQSGETGHFL